jgi:hypothetical protein
VPLAGPALPPELPEVGLPPPELLALGVPPPPGSVVEEPPEPPLLDVSATGDLFGFDVGPGAGALDPQADKPKSIATVPGNSRFMAAASSAPSMGLHAGTRECDYPRTPDESRFGRNGWVTIAHHSRERAMF